MRPKPGRSGAMMWYLCDKRGARLRYWFEDEGKPWRRSRVGSLGTPAEM